MNKKICNPILPLDICIADGEPHVFDGRLYLFGSHDTPGGESFCLEDYEFYSAPLDDLSDWSSKGVNYSATQDPLYSEFAKYLYAPDVVRGNDGRFYLYYCLAGWKGKGGYTNPISVAVCDTPDGRYQYYGVVKNPDGSPYLDWVCFDPAVMNDNGVIRIYFGSGPFRGMKITKLNKFFLSKVYAKIFGKPTKSFLEGPGPLGANAAVLCDDMLTLKESPKRILEGADFKGHTFFEGSSIRKVGDEYGFVYSSEKNHELCYATSQYPDRGFKFRGTLISNGDVGVNGRKEKDRLNTTGTTHGGIEYINGQWYVFYHRLTHGSDYSRQMCAEPLVKNVNGGFLQAEMTTCGLNPQDLQGKGVYPAGICCNLTNGKMPHASNQIKTGIPRIIKDGEECFVSEASAGTQMVYKYFSLQQATILELVARGSGTIEVSFGNKVIGRAVYHNNDWEKQQLAIEATYTHVALTFQITSGRLDVKEFEFV